MNQGDQKQLARRRARYLVLAKKEETEGFLKGAKRARAVADAIERRMGIVAGKPLPAWFVPSRLMESSEKQRFVEGDPELLKQLSETTRYVDRRNPRIPDFQRASFELLPSPSCLVRGGPAQRMIDSFPRTQFVVDLTAMFVAEGMERRKIDRLAVPAILKALREAYPQLLPRWGFSEAEKRVQRVLGVHIKICRLNGEATTSDELLQGHAQVLASQDPRSFSSCRLWQAFVDRRRRAPGRQPKGTI